MHICQRSSHRLPDLDFIILLHPRSACWPLCRLWTALSSLYRKRLGQPFRLNRVQTLGRTISCHHLRVRVLPFHAHINENKKRKKLTSSFLFSLVCLFALIGAWIPPRSGSPFDVSKTHVQWYVVPAIGIGCLFIGFTYYVGFAIILPGLKHKDFIVERRPLILRQNGDPEGPFVFVREYIDFWWAARNPPPEAPPEEHGEVGQDLELDPIPPPVPWAHG